MIKYIEKNLPPIVVLTAVTIFLIFSINVSVNLENEVVETNQNIVSLACSDTDGITTCQMAAVTDKGQLKLLSKSEPEPEPAKKVDPNMNVYCGMITDTVDILHETLKNATDKDTIRSIVRRINGQRKTYYWNCVD